MESSTHLDCAHEKRRLVLGQERSSALEGPVDLEGRGYLFLLVHLCPLFLLVHLCPPLVLSTNVKHKIQWISQSFVLRKHSVNCPQSIFKWADETWGSSHDILPMGPGRPALPAGPGGPAEPVSPGGPMGPGGPLPPGTQKKKKKNRQSESKVEFK